MRQMRLFLFDVDKYLGICFAILQGFRAWLALVRKALKLLSRTTTLVVEV